MINPPPSTTRTINEHLYTGRWYFTGRTIRPYRNRIHIKKGHTMKDLREEAEYAIDSYINEWRSHNR